MNAQSNARPALPVIFRMESTGPGTASPVAIFPTLPGDVGKPHTATCYAHVGQHGTLDHGYAVSCRLAKPEEYADLLRELRGIYERHDDPEAVRLVVAKRWTKYHDEARIKER